MIQQTPSAKFSSPDWVEFLRTLAARFPLPWSHYVKLLTVKDENARRFYEEEALRGGWSVRQLENLLLKLAERRMTNDGWGGGEVSMGSTRATACCLWRPRLRQARQAIPQCFRRGRRKQHARAHVLPHILQLRCLVIIDLKLGTLDHADAGQMHLYLRYAAEHWTHDGENPPVGIILCSAADEALARCTLDTLPNKIMAREYQLALPAVKKLEAELAATRKRLEREGK